MATIENFGLQDIAKAVADELCLDSHDSVTINQVTVSVTYSIGHHADFIDDWYESYLARQDEDVEFRSDIDV